MMVKGRPKFCEVEERVRECKRKQAWGQTDMDMGLSNQGR
jgi:hypothetical protein